jgi:sec-independent protein translocase protein TatB
MFFDIGWSELMLIGIVALVVIGPKDLPRAMRIAGYWMRKARTLSREFHSSIDQMIREAELEEMREELKKATEFNVEHEIQKTVDPTGELEESLKPPQIPDYFEEAEGPPPAATAPEPALPPPEEAAPEPAPVSEETADQPATSERAPGEPAPAPPKP